MRKYAVIVLCIFASQVLCGCGGVIGKRDLLTVDFPREGVLKYNIVSERKIWVDLDPTGTLSGKGRKGGSQELFEKLQLVMSYKSVGVDNEGLITVLASCESATVERKFKTVGRETKDAAEYLAGKSFTLKVTPAGRIADYSSLQGLISEVTEKTFELRNDGKSRIKGPDMMDDFLATQWFLWDAVSSVKKPLDGVAVGQIWESKLSVPLPMPVRVARDVKYKIEAVEKNETGSKAVITSKYAIASPAGELSWLSPYTGSYQMRGIFGFLGGYEILSLAGDGRQEIDIDRGVILRDEQRYDVEANASMFALGDKSPRPSIKIEQKISMELLGK